MHENRAIEHYIAAHTDPEGELLAELNRQTHLKVLMPIMLSGHVQGKTLSMISHMMRPKRILELGTYTGYSAICLAQGLTENGHLHTVEINDELKSFAHSYIQRAGLADKITLHIGSALEIVPTLDEVFDLVFIDADKREYPAYYEAVLPKMRKGGFIIADNVLWHGKVVENPIPEDDYTQGIVQFNDLVHRDTRVENLLLPVRDGLMVLRVL